MKTNKLHWNLINEMESGCSVGDEIIQPFYRSGPPRKVSPLLYIIWKKFEKLGKALLHHIRFIEILSTTWNLDSLNLSNWKAVRPNQ